MSLTQLLSSNKKIIINTDIDGILSGLLLSHYLGCEIVGFSNSDNAVWINKQKINSIYDAVYIDMYVPDAGVVCIDQHIVGANAMHNDVLKMNVNKLNPNLLLGKSHDPMSEYRSKYPLGVVHFIISLLEKDGIDVQLELNKIIHQQLTLGDLILRADDAMHTTVVSGFRDNALLWWRWLRSLSNNGKATQSLVDYLALMSSEMAISKKKNTAYFLKGAPYFCESGDGGYKSILTSQGQLKDSVKHYINLLASLLSVKSFSFSQTYQPFVGTTNRISLSPLQKEELTKHNAINGQKVFSYAFIWGLNKEGYFSYTVM